MIVLDASAAIEILLQTEVGGLAHLLTRVESIGAGRRPAMPRRFSRTSRLLAAALLLLFLGATLVTTTVSLGRYCLTSDAADTRSLPSKPRP